jgi:CIC family chloride channel protein
MLSSHFNQLAKLVADRMRPNLRVFWTTRTPLIWLIAVLVGVSASLVAILFRMAIGALQWLWVGTSSETFLGFVQALPWYVVLCTPAFGGLLVGLLLQFAIPIRRTSGVADVIEARTVGGRNLVLVPGLTSALATIISLGFGASAGREGPVVHLGATIASTLSDAFRLTPASHRILLACGVASAISASFNAPIAGVLFAHEVILGHYALTALAPIVIASASGAILSRIYFGEQAAFAIPDFQIYSYLEFPAFALLGVTCAVVAIIFQISLTGTDFIARSIKIPLWSRPVIGGFMVGAIGVYLPEVLGVGYEATDIALHSGMAVTLLLLLIVGKTAATAITLASRFGGGVFTPSLFLGAMTGSAFGVFAAQAFPELASMQSFYAVLGMGAVAAAVLGAPISTTVIVFELTGGFAVSIALLFVVAISSGLTQAVLGRSYFHWQLEGHGLVIEDGPHKFLMANTRVSEFMTELDPAEDITPFDVTSGQPFLRPNDSLESALRAFDVAGAPQLPVLDRKDITRQIGWAMQVDALKAFNHQLIETSVEEHR